MFKITLYYDGGFLRESDYELLDYEECEGLFEEWKQEYVEKWKSDGAWHDDDSEDLFHYDREEDE